MSLYLINHLGQKTEATQDTFEKYVYPNEPLFRGGIDEKGLYVLIKSHSKEDLYLRSDKPIFDENEFFDECKKIDFELPFYTFP
jgi:hypothetical protein